MILCMCGGVLLGGGVCGLVGGMVVGFMVLILYKNIVLVLIVVCGWSWLCVIGCVVLVWFVWIVLVGYG